MSNLVERIVNGSAVAVLAVNQLAQNLESLANGLPILTSSSITLVSVLLSVFTVPFFRNLVKAPPTAPK